jgi:hypothetical protein
MLDTEFVRRSFSLLGALGEAAGAPKRLRTASPDEPAPITATSATPTAWPIDLGLPGSEASQPPTGAGARFAEMTGNRVGATAGRISAAQCNRLSRGTRGDDLDASRPDSRAERTDTRHDPIVLEPGRRRIEDARDPTPNLSEQIACPA